MAKTQKIRYINIKEFRELGILQELNRLFLHPLGLALEVDIDEIGNEKLGKIWDYREDPEGMLYGDDMIKNKEFQKKIKNFAKMREKKEKTRRETLGFVIQFQTK